MNPIKRLLHRHKWILHGCGEGVFQKGKQNIEIVAVGHTARCDCGKRMFFPNNPQLYPVDLVE